MKKFIVLCFSTAALALLSACTTPSTPLKPAAYSTPPPINDPASAPVYTIVR